MGADRWQQSAPERMVQTCENWMRLQVRSVMLHDADGVLADSGMERCHGGDHPGSCRAHAAARF